MECRQKPGLLPPFLQRGRKMELRTKRLRIVPLSIRELRLLLESTARMEEALGLTPSGSELDEHTKEAMQALCDQAIGQEDHSIWVTNWQVILDEKNQSIGSACFTGRPDRQGSVELGYGLQPEHRGRGYMTEAARALCQWALSQPGVRRVTAQTEHGNTASQQVLLYCGMRRYKATEECVFWKLEKEEERE